MTIQEYVDKSKDELDKFLKDWISDNSVDDKEFPLEMSEEAWYSQELYVRFGL